MCGANTLSLSRPPVPLLEQEVVIHQGLRLGVGHGPQGVVLAGQGATQGAQGTHYQGLYVHPGLWGHSKGKGRKTGDCTQC